MSYAEDILVPANKLDYCLEHVIGVGFVFWC